MQSTSHSPTPPRSTSPVYSYVRPPIPGQPLPRQLVTLLIRTGIKTGEHRFARQLSLAWLSVFPGDLPIRLAYAEAIQKDARPELALPVLERLCQTDPEYLAAVEARFTLETALNQYQRASYTAGLLYALGSTHPSLKQISPPEWSTLLHQARQAIGQPLPSSAISSSPPSSIEKDLLDIVAQQPSEPLVAVTHLEWLRQQASRKAMPAEALRNMAEYYHVHFPDCLQCLVSLATALLESGEPEKGVSRLHQAASQDLTGQVATRMWGDQHPYRRLWPQQLEAHLDISIPPVVAAALGWNQLPAPLTPLSTEIQNIESDTGAAAETDIPSVNPTIETIFPEATSDTPNVVEPDTQAETGITPPDTQPAAAIPDPGMSTPTADTTSDEWMDDLAWLFPAREAQITPGKYEIPQSLRTDTPSSLEPGIPDTPPLTETPTPAFSIISPTEPPVPARSPAQAVETHSLSAELQEIQDELEKIGQHLKKPSLAKADGRFPIYVLLTTRTGLETQYGHQNAARVEHEMRQVAQTIQGSHRWGALVFFGDEGIAIPHQGRQLEVPPAKYNDPWAIKLALVDLDATLAKQGAMIGAVLIVGGPTVVPFHHLTNPVDDSDADVLSDNPYATRDENYFIPEWPVGRLPGAEGSEAGDPAPIIQSLKNIAAAHVQKTPSPQPVPWYRRWVEVILGWLQRPDIAKGNAKGNFGYTTAAWRQSSSIVYRSIGETASLLVSPPAYSPQADADLDEIERLFGATSANRLKYSQNGKLNSVPLSLPAALLAYFNLHGVIDAPAWYGQSDPQQMASGENPDYPVALRPQDVGLTGKPAPQVIFSEACFGAYINDKTTEEALCLKFIQSGCRAFVGSTGISYGSIGTSLIAADFLGLSFWQAFQHGAPAGEALRQAKIALAHEMKQRQGYLDGEDQKTLIQFVLYGDPLAQAGETISTAKNVLRHTAHPLPVDTICDRAYQPLNRQQITPEKLERVKTLVETYLPGMLDASLVLRGERTECAEVCQHCAARNLHRNVAKMPTPNGHAPVGARRNVVILSKQINSANHHQHFARMTLDDEGHLLKLVVSR